MITITYDGSTTAPTNAGSYTVAANLDNANYDGAGSNREPCVINKAPATINLSNLIQTYDGTPKSATATTDPAGLGVVTITYDGSTTAPTNAGSYAVAANLDNANYTAPEATGTLVINKAPATINLSNLIQTYDGTPKSATATTILPDWGSSPSPMTGRPRHPRTPGATRLRPTWIMPTTRRRKQPELL